MKNDIELGQAHDLTTEILKGLGVKLGHSLKIMKRVQKLHEVASTQEG